jgi:hypothetical protein
MKLTFTGMIIPARMLTAVGLLFHCGCSDGINHPMKTRMEKSMSTRFELAVRDGDHPQIGQEPPQLQFSDLGPEDIRLALKEWAFSTFPNVSEHDTMISVPTSRALWLDGSISAAHDDAFMPTPGSREFCHLHEDGSFHTVVDAAVEDEILEKQWGVRHMYYDRGVKEMLVYAPRNSNELIVAKKIITESYRYASGDMDFILKQ